MAKDGPKSSTRPSRTRSDQKVRSPPNSLSSEPRHEPAERKHQQYPDPNILSKGEKSQEEFQVLFGRNLKAARLKSGLKQSEVAALTGLTQQYLSLIEAGQQNVTVRTMALLAKVVDHDIIDLLQTVTGTDSKK